ncbi:MAG: S-layer homology domain-containing protein [Oscillospiraceae bacterium]
MFKKSVSLLLSVLFLLTWVAPAAYAVDDAVGLAYEAKIVAHDKNGTAITQVDSGETFLVDVLLDSTGVASAPLYALQGKLAYDSTCLLVKTVEDGANITTALGSDVVSFGLLDKTMKGITAADPLVVATITFEALQDGMADIQFRQFDVTNADASKRSVDLADIVTIKLGTGVRVEDKPALLRQVEACKTELNSVIISASAADVAKNVYWVTAQVHDKLKDAFVAAQAVYNSATASTEEVAEALRALTYAMAEFRVNKAYGTNDGRLPPEDNNQSSGRATVTVTATAGEHGKIAPGSEKQKVPAKTSVTITSIPDAGYEVWQVLVNGKPFPGATQFTIPKVTNDTAVKVTFRWKNVFTDVTEENWFYDAAMFAHEKGLMKGVGDDRFAPMVMTSRGMFLTTLYRMAGSPKAAPAGFTDVSAESYCAKAVDWATENQITKGVSATRFAPEDLITREQMAALLYRYATVQKISATESKSAYADSAEIADFAKQAVDFCSAKGLMQGVGENQFAPKRQAIRAEMAAVLQRMVQLSEKQGKTAS